MFTTTSDTMESGMDTWDVAQFCYLTTKGRRTGHPHTIEIWFGMRESQLYMLSGGGDRSDWVRNLSRDPAVSVSLSGAGVEPRSGRARVVGDPREELMARRLLAAKYQGWREGDALSSWARTALPVAVDFEA
jgi:deazaflavin-dependent oxidoreductase (nitroreductase family)